jgi:hypothetical protein
MDFRLSDNTVRNPDVAFIEAAQANALAIEDMARKVHQYLQAGCLLVWIAYPALRMIESHSKQGVHQIREP